jgi:hypothetical protein
MKYFVDSILKPFITECGYQRVCEIGASEGEGTNKLLQIDSIEIAVVDPCLDADLSLEYRDNKRISLYQGLSLDVLGWIPKQFDCILIDGDHNWFTVYNELKTIEERGLIAEGGTIFFHDVCWPYGRRDMYYQPEQIPKEFAHPYEKKGIVYGQSELSSRSKVNAEYYNAVYEGGPRNGVLTAIEDFVRESSGQYRFFCMKKEFGLGVLHKSKSGTATATFNRFRLRSKYTNALYDMKDVAQTRLPGFYSLLRRLRSRVM